MKIVLYGRLADEVGREIELEVGNTCTVGSIREQLARNHASLGKTLMNGRARAILGGALATDDQCVSGDHVLEFLPPVSGG